MPIKDLLLKMKYLCTPLYLSFQSPVSFTQFHPSAPQVPSSNLSAMNAQSSTEFVNIDSWIIDTGASNYMSHDVNVLTRATSYEGNENIIVGNGEGLEVKNIGGTTLHTQSHVLHLKNVLHVPMLTVNLLSVK